MNKTLVIAVILSVIWTIPWKGIALWKAAKRGDKAWFIILLLINTLAILEIAYIFVFFSEKKEDLAQNNLKNHKKII